MKVASLHLFPVKAIGGIAVDSATTAERGFVGDRRYMVTDQTGRFLSQRTHPRLGHVRAERVDGGWKLAVEGDELVVSRELSADPVDVSVWSDEFQACRVSDDADRWFSDLLGEPVQLVVMPAEAERATAEGPAVSFADGYPYLVTVVASLQDLNERIPGDPVSMDAFRPNVVVSGVEAWAEDDWRTLHIGDARFDITTPCVRCKVTTLDPTAPDRPRADNEPLRTLASFRRADGGVIFGVNAVCRTPGIEIEPGMSVTVS